MSKIRKIFAFEEHLMCSLVQKTAGGYVIGDNTRNMCRCKALHGTFV